eukprot:TRINITY_DN5455_c0_g1_i1.p1 TRINITY_DN5455_c0_g1~~TRINITY_DN5455_c0_g1_i1.p1  ORF type:complete len:1216 (+),score=283.50 TRINITY_DN5455_c0_g1_i1:77-3724(+)
MGQSTSSLPVKRFINDPSTAVGDALEGYLWTTNGVGFLEGFPDTRVLVRSDWKKQGVAIVTGGGSGHEPSDAGMIGEGMITAAVCGDIFASPAASTIAQALAAVTGPAGTLAVIRNNPGTRLNFQVAVRDVTARLGLCVKVVHVGDDITSCKKKANGDVDFSKARGIAGSLLALKVAGAAAQAGLSLDDVYNETLAVAQEIRTQGVCFTSCTIPGQPITNPIPPDEMEIGLGIHGESGQLRVKAVSSAQEVVDTMMSQLKAFLPADGPLCVMLNNMGSVPQMEMAIVAAQIMKSELGPRIELFVGPAHFMTTLDMNGISLSMMPLNPSRVSRLCAPTSCRGWMAPVKPTAPKRIHCKLKMSSDPDLGRVKSPVTSAATSRSSSLDGRVISPATSSAISRSNTPDGATVLAMVQRVCEALIGAENELNTLDALVANGDCGRGLAHAARLLEDAIPHLPVGDPGRFFGRISQILRRVGGMLPALFSVFFQVASDTLGDGAGWQPVEGILEALSRALAEMEAVCEVGEGMRTFLDALCPALRAVTDSNVEGCRFQAAARAAQEGARLTATMEAFAGRASYAPREQYEKVPDAGAMAVALVLTAMAGPTEGRLLSVANDDELQSNVKLGEVIGRGSFGVVYAAKYGDPGIEVAVKVSKRGKESGPRSFGDLDCLERQVVSNWLFKTKLHIVRVFEVKVSPSHVQLVMEKLNGPNLSDYLQARDGDRTEEEVAELSRQMLTAVREIHSNRMVHRDLKLDNFRFTDMDMTKLKLVDVVGTMCFRLDRLPRKVVCGTGCYLSPEALLGQYSAAVDMWALGVVVYYLLSGTLPYEVSSLSELKIAHGKPLDLEANPWRNVSEDAKSFVLGLLEMDPSKRLSVTQALDHEWVIDRPTSPESRALDAPRDNSRKLEKGHRRLGTVAFDVATEHSSGEQEVPRVKAKKTIFLVRHGEALHNIEERNAKKRVEAEAAALGLAKDSPECKEMVAKAKKAVLNNEEFHDAQLSPAGKAQALEARAAINQLKARGLPEPTSILVSPLERTLQTAAIVFANHPNMHVREELRERRTGLPCDERKAAEEVAMRTSFCFMSFENLRNLDSRRSLPDVSPTESPSATNAADGDGGSPEALPAGRASSGLRSFELEDTTTLRARTARIFELLEAIEDKSVAVVTHKGFLRELERGPLGRPDAAEFNNCEVRAYDLELLVDGTLRATLRFSREKMN